MPEYLSIGQVAQRFRVPPQRLTNLFYREQLSGDSCPVVSGRRLIPLSYLAEIERVLKQRGLIREEAVNCA